MVHAYKDLNSFFFFLSFFNLRRSKSKTPAGLLWEIQLAFSVSSNTIVRKPFYYRPEFVVMNRHVIFSCVFQSASGAFTSHIHVPIMSWTGMSQDFRLPIFRTYIASTNGAHKSFNVYGNDIRLYKACNEHEHYCLYTQ